MSGSPDDVRTAVAAHLATVLGEPRARAAVTFVGAEVIEVLRFGPDLDGVVRYASIGMSARPMTDPGSLFADPVAGPRAELVLSLRGRHDSVFRALATLAASPVVEGLVAAPGATLDLGVPLWDGGSFTAVLLAQPGGLVPDLRLPPVGTATPDPVWFLPALPVTATEAAWKRVHGAAALEERWLRHGTDLRDPRRAGVVLG